jgi:hypothetical protein
MSRSDLETKEQRLRSFEQFEQRLVMSAQSVAAVMPDIDAPVDPQSTAIMGDVEHATDAAEAAHIASQYGFDGSGQTIAVIDSGIAWDHYALGDGFGEGHKVVGGWDFAENDANPYDDGPAGFHGTHVSGIIASEDSTYTGVAPGADLVGLRVFDDGGAGNIEWVEQALQWVHDNIDTFENPITTVNLSLGTDWNAENTPEWTILEDELAQLRADGLFISVAAGNEFEDYSEKGLSYPAASPFVVPVASHGADDQLSDFSQREDNVLAAPGERVLSTVPDHLFGGTTSGEYLGATGTSMAAPYVAGASAVLRQANASMGVTDIDQTMLYQQLWDSANQIYDAITDTSYRQIDLDAAIQSVIRDDHGDTIGHATDVGLVQGGELVRGTIGKLTDIDQFAFTSDTDGRVTLNFDVSDNLEPLVEVMTADGESVEANFESNEISFDVVEGQRYQFAVATANGSGHYEIFVTIEEAPETPPATDLGTIASHNSLQTVAGEQVFEFETSQDGLLSLQANVGSGAVAVELYDAEGNYVSSGESADGSIRFDLSVGEGESFFAKVLADGSVEMKLDNVVSLTDGQLSISGTDADDTITVTEGEQLQVSFNGTDYTFEHGDISGIMIRGERGSDSITVELSDQYARATLQNNRFDAVGDNAFRAIGFESIEVNGSGEGQIVVLGTDDQEMFNASLDGGVELTASGRHAIAQGFANYIIDGKGGQDSIDLVGSDGDDIFFSKDIRNVIRNSVGKVVALNFENVLVDGSGGHDLSNLFDSAGNDQFIIDPTTAQVIKDGLELSVGSFERINAFSSTGSDELTMYDSVFSENINFRNEIVTVSGGFFQNYAKGFAEITLNSQGGEDVANLQGTEGSDRYYAGELQSTLITSTQALQLNGVGLINMISDSQGYDMAFVVGSESADTIDAEVNQVTASIAETVVNKIAGFDLVEFDGRGGVDVSNMVGSELNERLTVDELETEFRSTVQLLRMVNTEESHFDGRGGVDEAIFDDFEELDLLSAIGDKATTVLNEHVISAENIEHLEANAVDSALAVYDMVSVDFDYSLNGLWEQQ